MNIHRLPPKTASNARVNASASNAPRARVPKGGTLLSTIAALWPHMWPSGRPDLKRRVLMAFVLLIGA
jgi:ATP-binding cassette subfamily B protein